MWELIVDNTMLSNFVTMVKWDFCRWELIVDNTILSNFVTMVKQDFCKWELIRDNTTLSNFVSMVKQAFAVTLTGSLMWTTPSSPNGQVGLLQKRSLPDVLSSDGVQKGSGCGIIVCPLSHRTEY